MSELKEIFIELHKPTNGMEVFLMLTVDFVLVFFLIGIFTFIDAACGDKTNMSGTVVGRDYHPSYVQITQSGNTTITTVIPESWSIDVSVPEIRKELTCMVNEESYDNSNQGSKAEILVSSGYFTSNYYCL